jgi:glycyl-tRNA synthetase
MSKDVTMQKIVSLCKRRGFVFQSSEIYGGFEATYDFGPLGVEMLRNIKNLWWKEFVHKRPDVVGLDGAIISHPRVWEASGHTESFADAMVEDLETHKRYRADHIIGDYFLEKEDKEFNADGMELEELDKVISENNILSPDGNKLSKAKHFNQLVEVEIGTTESSKETAYLRGETCQPMFYNFDLVKDSMRLKVPFGIAQIGKAFRNEIKVGPFFFRTREFEQMELEMYVHPDDAKDRLKEFKEMSLDFLESIGLKKSDVRMRDQEFKERAHYNKVATDAEYKFPGGWREFQGIHYRSDWDLSRHGEFSGSNFTYKDEERNEEYIPHVVEYSIGASRLMLVLLLDAYKEDGDRVVLKLHKDVAPYRAAVFPLVKNKENITDKAKEVYQTLIDQGLNIAWDSRGNIGKRYLSQDEIGTPYCITIDYDTLEDNTVTVRDRDTTKQDRVKIEDLAGFIC